MVLPNARIDCNGILYRVRHMNYYGKHIISSGSVTVSAEKQKTAEAKFIRAVYFIEVKKERESQGSEGSSRTSTTGLDLGLTSPQ